MITVDEALQRLSAQVAKAGVHESVCTVRLFYNKEYCEGFKVGLFEQLFQASGFVLLRFAVKEDLMSH